MFVTAFDFFMFVYLLLSWLRFRLCCTTHSVLLCQLLLNDRKYLERIFSDNLPAETNFKYDYALNNRPDCVSWWARCANAMSSGRFLSRLFCCHMFQSELRITTCYLAAPISWRARIYTSSVHIFSGKKIPEKNIARPFIKSLESSFNQSYEKWKRSKMDGKYCPHTLPFPLIRTSIMPAQALKLSGILNISTTVRREMRCLRKVARFF